MLKRHSKTLLLAVTLALPLTLQAKCGGTSDTAGTAKATSKTSVSAHASNSAAYTLLATMNMKESYEGMIKRVTQMQISQNPQLKDIEPTIHAFFTKYMGWEAQRGDIAALYAKNYTLEELQTLNTFYQTALGQKTVQLMPQLAAAGAKIGQSKLAAHMGELKLMVDAEIQKINANK